MAMGQDPDLVREITAAVKAVVDIPVIPKLTPNTPDIADIAAAAIAGGADGLCAINTLGPGYTSAHGHAVLSNGAGGMSGKGILPIGLKCVREIRAVTDCPIIGCGGVSSADDVRAYFDAGATVVGVGSSLTGLTTDEIGTYFQTLSNDLETGRNRAESHIRYDIDMSFRPVTLVDNHAGLRRHRPAHLRSQDQCAGRRIRLPVASRTGREAVLGPDRRPVHPGGDRCRAIHARPDGPAARHRGLRARPARHTRRASRGCKNHGGGGRYGPGRRVPDRPRFRQRGSVRRRAQRRAFILPSRNVATSPTSMSPPTTAARASTVLSPNCCVNACSR